MNRDTLPNTGRNPVLEKSTLTKAYDPQTIEQRTYKTWETAGYFAPQGGDKPYCIMIPPPNVTGSLHMGHAFQDTLMDALIRYHRMRGRNTLWQAGTDHAGIATQMVVERQLESEGKSRHDLGRDEFIRRVWDWKTHSGGTITRQLRRLGASLDWSRERFTMDEGLSRAVTEVFVRLHEEGLIYRGKRLVNWDPVLHTAVSDLEVVSEEENGYLWHIRYPLADGGGHLVVATTRPETMLGDAAVAVHPGDERYKHLVGQLVDLPLTGRRIPVIADDYVDPEFGSGCVKITPAHDFNDYEVGKRHNLPMLNILTPDAKIIGPLSTFEFETRQQPGRKILVGDAPYGKHPDELIPKSYQDLDRFDARKRIVADLEAQGLLEKTEAHKLMVPRGDRSQAVVEPYLTDQWYVKVEPLAQSAIEAVEDGRIRFVPENWSKTYFEWMRNIKDWCISRQIWWGHRIPAWYDDKGNCYVGHSETEVRKKHGLGADVALAQDPDVLDTWFSSALWPFSTLGWPDETPELKTFYPTSVLVTGFDIIFFWVARMIMMGLKFMNDVPFREVYIHGLVRDAHGQKMSKSKGNILDPIDLIDGIDLESLVKKRTTGLMRPQDAPKIEQATRKEFADGIPAYGTDALRFTFASLATQGRNINFDLGRIGGYRNFCNKLWNAARYVLMNTEGKDCGQNGGGMVLNRFDRWIITRLQQTEQKVIESIENYRFDLASQAIYDFTWYEYCDWYLEFSKPVLQSQDSAEAALRGTRRTLVTVLETLLRLLHPLMPFITEELWRRVAPKTGSSADTIMRRPYPTPDPNLVDTQAIEEVELVKQFNLGIRNIRGEMNIPSGKRIRALVKNLTPAEQAVLKDSAGCSMMLSRLEAIEFLATKDSVPESATALVGMNGQTHIPMAGLIDTKAELMRLNKEIEKLRKEQARSRAKLANPNFSERAPREVVDQERSRIVEFESALAKLQTQHAKVKALAG
jgi:valyl-tRNA synthetase